MDGFSPAVRRQLDAQGRRIADLERALAALSGVGVSTRAGATEIRATQVGFPGVTTGPWDSTTGYPWKRRKLDRTAFVNPAVQLTGTGAVSLDGVTSYPAGTTGWFEPSPDGVGYVFTPAGAGATTPPDSGSACPTGPGWVQGLETFDCISLTVVGALGKCSCLNTTQVYPLLWDGGVKGWTIPATNDPPKFAACSGQQVTPLFFLDGAQNPALHMTVGSRTYRLTLDCCGFNSAYFTGDSLLCSGVRPFGTDPANNLFRVKVEWGGAACGVQLACCPGVKFPRRLYLNFPALTAKDRYNNSDRSSHPWVAALSNRSFAFDYDESPTGPGEGPGYYSAALSGVYPGTYAQPPYQPGPVYYDCGNGTVSWRSSTIGSPGGAPQVPNRPSFNGCPPSQFQMSFVFGCVHPVLAPSGYVASLRGATDAVPPCSRPLVATGTGTQDNLNNGYNQLPVVIDPFRYSISEAPP